MRAPSLAALLALLLYLLLPCTISACDCGDPGPPCKAFANTPVIFAGRVVKIATIILKAPSGDPYEDRLIHFEIDRSYRGSVGNLPEGFLPSSETVTLEPYSCATIRFLATPPPRTK